MVRSLFSVSALAVALAGCAGEPIPADDPFWTEEYEHDQLLADPNEPEPGVTYAPGLTVQQAAFTYCSTASVRGLSEQLVEEIECLQPGTIRRLDEMSQVALGTAAMPHLQAPAANGLKKALSGGGTIGISSALRTLVQQYVLYSWYVNGRCTNVVTLAAPPGKSNHESGLAIDVPSYGTWRSRLASAGFAWFGAGDVVHFDYVAGGVDLRPLSVKAFQRLWNRNRPDAPLAVDGVYGPTTASALASAPADGFAKGASCAQTASVPIEVYWSRQADGSYDLRALAPQEIVRVEYYVDGYQIGQASRSDGGNFPDNYAFSLDKSERLFEVRGYDASGAAVGRGVGLLDVTAGTAVFIKQLGAGLYEIGLERAPAAVASIEVRADGWLLADQVSGQTRSGRNAVRYLFQSLGKRQFQITTYGADGAVRGHLHRTFTLQ